MNRFYLELSQTKLYNMKKYIIKNTVLVACIILIACLAFFLPLCLPKKTFDPKSYFAGMIMMAFIFISYVLALKIKIQKDTARRTTKAV